MALITNSNLELEVGQPIELGKNQDAAFESLIPEKPTDTSKQNAIAAILAEAGIGKPDVEPESEHKKLKKTLKDAGASVENASKTIAHVMQRGKYDASRLKAAELVFDLHGLRDKDGGMQKQPIFQFLIRDSTINVNQIFSPLRGSETPLNPNKDPEHIIDIDPDEFEEIDPEDPDEGDDPDEEEEV